MNVIQTGEGESVAQERIPSVIPDEAQLPHGSRGGCSRGRANPLLVTVDRKCAQDREPGVPGAI